MKTLRWFTLAAPILTVACHDSILLGGDGGPTENATAQAQGGPIDARAPVDDAGETHDASRAPDAFEGLDAPATFDAIAPEIDAAAGPYAYFYGNSVNPGAVYGVWSGTEVSVAIAVGGVGNDVGQAVAQYGGSAYYTSEQTPGSGGADGPTYNIFAASLVGPNGTLIAAGQDGVRALAADASYVYYLNQTPGGFDPDAGPITTGYVERVPVGGGVHPQVLATETALVNGIAVDSTYVYWTQTVPGTGGVQPGSIVRVPLAGGTVETLAQGQATPLYVAVDQGNVYWLNEGTMQADCTSSDGSLVELAQGAATPVVLATGLHGPSSIAARGGDVYASLRGAYCNTGGTTSGSVIRIGPGGVVTPLATGLSVPSNLYVDGPYAYFTTITDPLSSTMQANLVQR